MPVKQRTWQTLSEQKLGKPVKITVWKNKDFEAPGQEVTFHPKHLRSWNSVLDYLTNILKPRFGAVRKLYHLGTKKLVLNLEDIKASDKYVAVGSEKARFPKNGYFIEQEGITPNRPNTPLHADNVDYLLNFLAFTKKKRRTVVYFMVSGRSAQVPLKVVFIERDFLDDAILLEYLGYRLDVGEGIQYICNIKGKIVPNLIDLKHGHLYIVVPFSGKFVKLDYSKLFAELHPSKTIEFRQPKKQKSDTVNGVKRKSWKKDKQSGSLASLDAKCVGVTCTDADCRIAGKKRASKETNIEDGQREAGERRGSQLTDWASIEEIQCEARERCGSPQADRANIEERQCQARERRGRASIEDRQNEAHDQFRLACKWGSIEERQCEAPERRGSPQADRASTEDRQNKAHERLDQFRLACKWDAYNANLRESVSAVSEDVGLIKCCLDDILDKTLVEIEERGTTTPNFITSGVAHTDEDESARERVGNNMTTFAEIARHKKWMEEAQMIFAFDSIPVRYSSDDLGSTALSPYPQKSVTFCKNDKPGTIYESREAPSEVDLNQTSKCSKVILKACKDDNTPMEIPQPDENPPVLRPSFLKARDSVAFLHSDLERFMAMRSHVKESESIATNNVTVCYPGEAKTSLCDIVSPCKMDNSKCVQKDWTPNEDILDKGIQAGTVAGEMSLAQLLENTEEDVTCMAINPTASNVDDRTPFRLRRVRTDGNRQSTVEPGSRREESDTFACSDICLHKCDADGECSEKCL